MILPRQEIDLSVLLENVTADYELINERPTQISLVRNLTNAGPHDISFANDRHLDELRATRAGVVVTDIELGFLESLDQFLTTVWIRTKHPRRTVAELAKPFEPGQVVGVDSSACIDREVEMGDNVSIGPLVSIGRGVAIGPDTVVGAGAHILHDVVIGRHVRIGAGTVIGSVGFGYEETEDGWLRLPHLGSVVIGNDVDVGANTCIDRGTFGDTVIEDGVKIDNLVHIAHNVRVGRAAVVIANSMIGGSVSVGPRAWIAPSTSVLNGLKVGRDAYTGMGAVVIRDVEDEDTVAGVPARSIRKE